MRRVGLWVAVLLVLGACTEGPGLILGAAERAQRSPFYGPHLVQYVARDGTFPVVIQGNPLALPKSEAEQAIAQRLRLPAWTSGARFVPVEDAASRRALRLVLVFDPAGRRLDGNAACADPSAVPTGSEANSLALLAVFCNANEALSQTIVSGRWPTGADHSRLSELLDRATRAVCAYRYPGRPRGGS